MGDAVGPDEYGDLLARIARGAQHPAAGRPHRGLGGPGPAR